MSWSLLLWVGCSVLAGATGTVLYTLLMDDKALEGY
jgi:hypothetical protein